MPKDQFWLTKLKASEQNFRNSMDSSLMGIRIIDVNLRTLYANKVFLNIFGYKNIDEISTTPLQDHYTPEEYAHYLIRKDKRLRGENVPDNESVTIISNDGCAHTIRVYPNTVLWDGKQQRQFVYVDITGQQKAEEALKASEERYRRLFETAKDGILIQDASTGLVIDVNPFLIEMVGFPRDEFLGKAVWELKCIKDPITVKGIFLELQRKGYFRYGDLPLEDADGRRIDVEFIANTYDVENQKVIQCNIRDISARMQAEKQRDLYIKILHLLNQSGGKNVLIHDLLEVFKEDGPFEAVGIRLHEGDDYPYYATNGFPHKHIKMENRICAVDDKGNLFRDSQNRPILDCMCGNVISGRFDPSKPFFTDGGSFWTNSTTDWLASTGLEVKQLRIRDGCSSEGYESVALIPLKANEVTIGLLQINDTRRDRFTLELIKFYEGLAQSVGIALAQKQIEESLHISEASYRGLFESAADAIIIADATTALIIDVNPSSIDLLGISRSELIGKKFFETKSFENIVSSKKGFEDFIQKKSVYCEDLTLKTSDDRQIPVEFISNVYNVDKGEVIQCNIRDISDRKKTEEERRKLEEKAQVASRLASVGEMAAGIAHEINNPLTGVLGFSQLLLKKENVPEDIKDNLKLIADGSQRVADVVKRLLIFARQVKPNKTLTNLNELVDNTLKLREYVLRTNNIEVVTRLDPDLPWTIVDPGQLQQVFLNLIVNAEQAMRQAHGRGTLTITSKKKGNTILISFKDNGHGISKENMKRLFDPFFTTKAPGEGTGLGLSLSRSIILDHGGQIDVDTNLGHGATFTIELPIVEALSPEAEKTTALPKVKSTTTKKGRILVVDDETGVRELLKEVLTPIGYSVETIAEATIARDKLSAGEAYDIILADIRMPGMSGIELYSLIVDKKPEMKNKVIFITGDNMSPDIISFLHKNNLPGLSKPFDLQALEEKIDLILNSD